MDKKVLAVATYFLSSSINFFHFGCGMMSPSLLDMTSLTLLPPQREVNLAELFSSSIDSEFDSSNARESFNKFISKEIQKSKTLSF